MAKWNGIHREELLIEDQLRFDAVNYAFDNWHTEQLVDINKFLSMMQNMDIVIDQFLIKLYLRQLFNHNFLLEQVSIISIGGKRWTLSFDITSEPAFVLLDGETASVFDTVHTAQIRSVDAFVSFLYTALTNGMDVLFDFPQTLDP